MTDAASFALKSFYMKIFQLPSTASRWSTIVSDGGSGDLTGGAVVYLFCLPRVASSARPPTTRDDQRSGDSKAAGRCTAEENGLTYWPFRVTLKIVHHRLKCFTSQLSPIFFAKCLLSYPTSGRCSYVRGHMHM